MDRPRPPGPLVRRTRHRSRRATPSPPRSRRSGWWSCSCRRRTDAPGGRLVAVLRRAHGHEPDVPRRPLAQRRDRRRLHRDRPRRRVVGRARARAGPPPRRVAALARRGPGRTARRLRLTSLVLLSIGLACAVALHVLRPDLGPAGHRISEYATGRTATSWRLASSASASGCSPSVRRCRHHSGGSLVVAVAISAAGLAMVASGIWRTDPDRVGVTTDAIHSGVGHRDARADRRRRRGRPCPAGADRAVVDRAGGLAVVAALFGALSPALHQSSWTGVSQRLLWLALLGWLVVTAWQLRPMSPAP